MAAILLSHIISLWLLPVAAERDAEFVQLDDPTETARPPVSTGALNLNYFPKHCDPTLVIQGCAAINGGIGVEVNPQLIRKAISASRLSNQEFWAVFPANDGSHTFSCSEICSLTTRFARQQGVVLAPKSDIGCRLVDMGREVVCDEDATPEQVSMFVRHSTGDKSRDMVESSYHPLKNRKFEKFLVNAHRVAYDDEFFQHQESLDGAVDVDSDFDTVDYSVWKYALTLLGIFRIYGALPEADVGATFSPITLLPSSGSSLVEEWQKEAAQTGVSTTGWYDDVRRVEARALMYATLVRNQFLRGKTGKEFRAWFGKHRRNEIAKASDRVKEVINSLISRFTGSLDFYYDRKCDNHTYAYVYPHLSECLQSKLHECTYYVDNRNDRRYMVYLCDLYLRSNMQEQIETIIHEVSHHREAFTDDVCLDPPHNNDRRSCKKKAYNRPNCLKLAQKYPPLALENADNYCYFAFDVGEAVNHQKQCETQSNRATGPARTSKVDSDGDCHCVPDTVCYQGNRELCQCSDGDNCEGHYLPSCTDCRCQPTTTTTTTTQEIQERPSFRDCSGYDEGGVKYEFPDGRGDCQCKQGYHCVHNKGADNGLEGCPYSGQGYHSLKFRASCFACECEQEQQGRLETATCGDKQIYHLKSEQPDGDGDCQCADGYRCYRKDRRGVRKRGCPIKNSAQAEPWENGPQGYDKSWFNSKCTECVCIRQRKKTPLPPVEVEPTHRCKHAATRVDNDCVCAPGKFCSTDEDKDKPLVPALMCKISDGTTSLTAFNVRHTNVQCHVFKNVCTGHGSIDESHNVDSKTDENHNCKCHWGHSCYLPGQSEPGCVSTKMMRDPKYFVPIGGVQCRARQDVCPSQVEGDVKSEFADDDGDCACASSKCWQKVENGIRPGCRNSRPKLSKVHFSHDCEDCTCKSEPPKCPLYANRRSPDADGDCKCPEGQLCRIKGSNTTQNPSGTRCKASDGTSDLHEYFSLTCEDCECYDATCRDGTPPLSGGVCTCPQDTRCYTMDGGSHTMELGCDSMQDQDETYYAACQNCKCMTQDQKAQLLAMWTTTSKPGFVDPCNGFRSTQNSDNCEMVVKDSKRRKTAFFRSAFCKCPVDHVLTGKKRVCRRGHRRYFAPRDLAFEHCCCVRSSN